MATKPKARPRTDYFLIKEVEGQDQSIPNGKREHLVVKIAKNGEPVWHTEAFSSAAKAVNAARRECDLLVSCLPIIRGWNIPDRGAPPQWLPLKGDPAPDWGYRTSQCNAQSALDYCVGWKGHECDHHSIDFATGKITRTWKRTEDIVTNGVMV